MSAQANIVAFDGAATPVSHTFVPISSQADPKTQEIVATWREANAALPIYAAASVETRSVKLKNGVWRASMNVSVPVMESVTNQNAQGYTAAPKVAFVDRVTTIGYFHERSTPTNRRLARQLSTNIMNNVTISVAAATTGPASELFDSQISAS